MNDNIKYYPVLPFVFDKNWQCNKKKCFQINNFLMFSKVNNDGRVSINYHDKIRFFSRSLSLTILLCLFLVLIFKSNQIKLR